MLSKRVKAITTMDLTEESRKELRRQVFEYELSHGLLRLAEIVKKTNEFPPDAGSTLEGRIELCLAFGNLSVRFPKAFETKALPAFLKSIRGAIVKISDEELVEKLLQAYLSVETELSLVAVLRYYFLNDQGEDSSDVDESCQRLKSACDRILAPMVKKDPVRGKVADDFALERNLRLHDLLGIIEGGVFYDDRFTAFLDKFSEEDVLKSAFQLTVEVQKALFGMAKAPSSRRTGEAATGGGKQLPEPTRKRVELEETTSGHETSKRTKTSTLATVSAAPGSTATRQSMAPPQLPMQKAQTQAQSRSKSRADLGETQPDTPTDSIPSPDSVASRSTSAGATASLQLTGRVKFTDAEDQALRAGVQRYGVGRWKAILDDPDYRDIFRSVKERTAMNLKDRWRNLQQK